MTYQLGIDLGTTSVAAALHRAGAQGPEVVPLGGTSATVPAVLHLARDGAVTVGDGASRRAGLDPGRVVRALRRRVGDPTPIVVGHESWTAEELSARMVRWVVDRVAEREGAAAAGIALAHPAAWSASTIEGLARALTGQDLAVTFVPEAVAVARAARREVTDGASDTLAVYDLGGGRCDAAVLRRGDRTGGDFALQGRPEGLADVGGLEFDDLLWEHVRAALPEGVVLDARVRRAVLRAKETLSAKAQAVVRVRQGEREGEVRVDRGTFEQLIAPPLDRTVVALQRVLASAELSPADLDAILLVGGSSRIPLVARTVSARLGRPVTVLDAAGHPVACGAALAPASGSLAQGTPAPAAVLPTVVLAAAAQRGPAAEASAPVEATPEPAVAAVPAAAPRERTTETLTPAATEPADEPAAEPASVAVTAPALDLDAPTVTLPLPASVDATTPYGTPVVTPKTATPEPAAGPTAAGRQGAPADPERQEGAPAGTPDPAPAAADPQPEAVRAPAVRIPAVLEPGARRGPRTRSLPRLLVGAGAVLVAALVVVALFRPDGPLDPPLDPVGNDAARVTGAPLVPTPVAPMPAVEGGPAGGAAEGLPADPADDPAAALRVDDAAAALVQAPARARASDDRGAVEVPADAGRSAVDTTPPPAPTVRTTGVGPAPRIADDRSEGAPVGAAPRTPPTPAAPRA